MKKGFTLAEVLITLGIIGVVAALTLPSLIQKYNEKVWITSYLRVYSILENAYKLALKDNGSIETIGYEGYGNYLYNIFKPYLGISSEFLENNGPWNKSINCLPDTIYNINGSVTAAQYGLNHGVPAVALKSGECIMFSGAFSHTLGYTLWVDINGRKGPNTIGKDQFGFTLDKERLAPNYSYHNFAEKCNIHDSSDSMEAGIGCGSWIVKHRNMDYLHLPFEEVEKQW